LPEETNLGLQQMLLLSEDVKPVNEIQGSEPM
jgi:hypothetical protein